MNRLWGAKQILKRPPLLRRNMKPSFKFPGSKGKERNTIYGMRKHQLIISTKAYPPV